MQPQMNPASPPTPGAPPSVAPQRPRSYGGLILLLLVLAAGAGYYAWQKLNPANRNDGGDAGRCQDRAGGERPAAADAAG